MSVEVENAVKFKINGIEAQAGQGKTILQAAGELGIKIPSLCNDGRLKPFGACRICVVEVEGARAPVPACATLVREGMAVNTDTENIKKIRKTILELLLSDHPSDCMFCDKCGDCDLQDLSYEYGVRRDKYKGDFHPENEQALNPFIDRNGEKCILCGRCVRICDEVQGANAIDFVNRGFDTIITTPFNRALPDTSCELCGQCVSTCPVGALTPVEKPGRAWETKKVRTVCPYCGCGCQFDLLVKDNKVTGVSTEEGIGVNDGNLCIKGRYGYHFVNHKDRLTKPLLRKDGKLVEVKWEEAVSYIAGKLKSIKEEHGPDSIAGLASAKCTNEENYLFQKFMRAVIGTNNVDHCARLCHAPSVAGLAKTFGSGAATGSISDIENAKAIFIIGSNTTEAHPIIGIAVKKAVKKGATLVVADPRKIFLAGIAKHWLRHRPGTDVMLLNMISKIIIDEGLQDESFIDERTECFAELKSHLDKIDLGLASKITGVDVSKLKAAVKELAGKNGICVLYSMGITQHTTGTDNVMAVANAAMLTGSIGRKNVGVFPLRGQNNVQGSCDSGVLPNVFSGYQSVADDTVREKFEKAWGTKLPSKPGKTVVELMNAADKGEVKAMYIMAENPMMSDPDINHVKEALQSLDLLVVQDIFLTETAKLADVVLPGSSFAEKAGTFTNTERRIQLVREAIDNIGQSKQDWEIIRDLSEAMGYSMAYDSPDEIMNEMAELSPILGGVSHGRLESGTLQWPCPDKEHAGTETLHAGQFSRGKGLFVPVGHIPPAEEVDDDFPILLTTGRMLQHYHTGTMSRRSKPINEVFPKGYIELSETDAKKLGIENGEEVTAESRRGQVKVNALVTDRVDEGVAFMPFHFWESPANALTNPALDKDAKIPELKVCAIKVLKATGSRR